MKLFSKLALILIFFVFLQSCSAKFFEIGYDLVKSIKIDDPERQKKEEEIEKFLSFKSNGKIIGKGGALSNRKRIAELVAEENASINVQIAIKDYILDNEEKIKKEFKKTIEKETKDLDTLKKIEKFNFKIPAVAVDNIFLNDCKPKKICRGYDNPKNLISLAVSEISETSKFHKEVREKIGEQKNKKNI